MSKHFYFPTSHTLFSTLIHWFFKLPDHGVHYSVHSIFVFHLLDEGFIWDWNQESEVKIEGEIGVCERMHGKEDGPIGWRRRAWRTDFMSMLPMPPPRALCLEGRTLDLMLCCHHLEFFNNFEQGSLHFHFALDPRNWIAGSEGQREGSSQWDSLRTDRDRANRKVS